MGFTVGLYTKCTLSSFVSTLWGSISLQMVVSYFCFQKKNLEYKICFHKCYDIVAREIKVL